MRKMITSGVARRERRTGGKEHRADHADTRQHRPETERADDARGDRLHAERADGGGEGDKARLKRRHAEADLQHERQEEWQRADAEPEQKAADQRGAKGRVAREPEIERWCFDFAGMEHISVIATAPPPISAATTVQGRRSRPRHRKPEGKAGDAEACEQLTNAVKRLEFVCPHRIDEAQRQRDAEKPDRNVDQEDPVPRRVGRDEAADRRADHRTDQSRHRHPGHGIDELALVDRAHQHEAADRRHHGAAHALHDAGDHEILQRRRHRASDRARP